MIEHNNYKNWPDFHTRLVIGLILVFVSVAFGYGVYKTYVVSTSDFRYTIITFYDRYSDSKRIGMKISYFAEGEYRHDNCFSNRCKKIKIGERRLGYYFLRDPSIYQINYDIVVPDSLVAPAKGWQEIPDFLLKQNE
jgi:hypothetical protein